MDEINTDPFDYGILGDAVACWKALMQQYGINNESCIPAIVVDDSLEESINARNTHVVKVQPLVDIVSSTGEGLKRPVMSVTVLRLVSGRYCVDFPINKGDTGWLIASDRDTFLQKSNNNNIDTSKNKGSMPPNTYELHKYKHGFFVPDSWSKFDLSKFSGSLVIGDIGDDGIPENYMTVNRTNGTIDLVSANTMSIYTKRAVIKSSEITKIDSPKVEVYGKTDVKAPLSCNRLSVKGNAVIGGNTTINNSAEVFGVLKVRIGGKTVEINPSLLSTSLPEMVIRKHPIIKSISTEDNATVIKTEEAFVLCTAGENEQSHKVSGDGGGNVLVDERSLIFDTIDGEWKCQIHGWNKGTVDHDVATLDTAALSIPVRCEEDDLSLKYIGIGDIAKYIAGLGNLGFDYINQKFLPGYFMAGRRLVSVDALTTIPENGGYVYLEITHTSVSSASAVMKINDGTFGIPSDAINTDTKTFIGLYTIYVDDQQKLYISPHGSRNYMPCVPLYE